MISVKYIASSDELTVTGSNGHIAVIPHDEYDDFKTQVKAAIIERNRVKGAAAVQTKEEPKND